MNIRKSATSRLKDLKLAIHRIEKGRASNGASKLSISSVAREVGVSAALIHNHYPSIAELIRTKQGASSRHQRDAKQSQLELERNKNVLLRSQLEEITNQLDRLASLNEMLLIENKELSAKLKSGNVFSIPKRT